jgi:hypothetical protein
MPWFRIECDARLHCLCLAAQGGAWCAIIYNAIIYYNYDIYHLIIIMIHYVPSCRSNYMQYNFIWWSHTISAVRYDS